MKGCGGFIDKTLIDFGCDEASKYNGKIIEVKGNIIPAIPLGVETSLQFDGPILTNITSVTICYG